MDSHGSSFGSFDLQVLSVRRTLRADLIQSVQNLGNHGQACDQKRQRLKGHGGFLSHGGTLVIIHFFGWIVHELNQPAIGDPPWLRKPPYGYKEPAPMENTFKIWCNWIWMNIEIHEMNVQWKPHVQNWDPLPCCSTCGTVGFSGTPASYENYENGNPLF